MYQNASWQYAKRTFDYAHMLVRDLVWNRRLLQQRFHKRQQHGIVGFYKLFHSIVAWLNGSRDVNTPCNRRFRHQGHIIIESLFAIAIMMR
jgi:hypothetical protein